MPTISFILSIVDCGIALRPCRVLEVSQRMNSYYSGGGSEKAVRDRVKENRRVEVV